MKILLIFTLCLISDGGASKEVTGYSGGGILIKCKYDTEYTYNQKYFCKGSMPGCSEQIKTGDKNQWVNSGRFSLFDDTKSSEFWVMITELTVQDNGTYHCGVNRTFGTDIYTPVELKVKEGSLVSREVTAYAGGRINIKCRHEDEYKNKSKTFCKIGTHQWCFNQNQTKPNSEWSHDGRFSIHDNRSAGFFSVFIRELNIEDTGTYACGGVVFDKLEIYTVMTLNVTEDMSYEKSISKTLHVGGDLTVRCKYPQSLRSDPKFLCRGRTQDFACFFKDSVKESRKYVTIGKFSLYDDREKQTFNVSIRDVTKQDSEYWCGAEKAWTSDHGYKVYFTRINLTVTDPYVPVSTSKPTRPSSSSISSSSSSSSSSSLSSPSLSSSSSSSSTSSPLLRLTDKTKSWTTPASPPADPYVPVSTSKPTHPSSSSSSSSSSLSSSSSSTSSSSSSSLSSPSLSSSSSSSSTSSPLLRLTDKTKSWTTPASPPADPYVPVSNSQPQNHPSSSSSLSSPSLSSSSSSSSSSSTSSPLLRLTNKTKFWTTPASTPADPYVPVSTSKPTHPSSSSSSSLSSPSLSSSSSSSSTSSPLLRLTDKTKSWTTPASPPAGFPASTVITVSVIVLLLLIGTITIFKVLQNRQDSASTTFGQDPGNQVVPHEICEN